MNFQITIPGKYSDLFLSKGIYDFDMALQYMRQLRYSRISDSLDLSLVLKEERGTCSTKHALLAAMAQEQNQTDIHLILAIYKMNRTNTPGIGSTLDDHGLEYLPEAHCYLKVGHSAIDITFPESNFEHISNAIVMEEIIESDQFAKAKIRFHKAYLTKWIEDQKADLTLEEVWEIREQCIQNLSM